MTLGTLKLTAAVSFFSLLKKHVWLLVVIFFILFLILGGYAMQSPSNRISSFALSTEAARNTMLGKAVAPLLIKHPNKSGIRLLGEPKDAFAARMILSLSAQKSLDIQYYIWEKDITGALLFESITEASMRGVRVRLLLDDNGISGLDEALLSLNRLENVQVRIFNPFAQRRFKWLGFITDFSRVNRRMHNKSFTADNTVTIVGGRNIGDSYFGATSGILRQDLDLVAVGKVVDEVSTDFDKYWASDSAYPIDDIVSSAKQSTYTTQEYMQVQVTNPKRAIYISAVERAPLVQSLVANEQLFEWKTAKMVSDDPAKGVGKHNDEALLFSKLTDAIGRPNTSLLLVTPYFVPTYKGVEAFAELVKSGVTINILTNSMQATDVLPVHSGYAKHRKTLLKAGVNLFEMRSSALQDDGHLKKLGIFGSSASSLHAKTFVIDSMRLFIGSFNFDQRSIHLNTELGFVIDSPKFSAQIEQMFKQQVSQTSYRLVLNDNKKIVWIETNGEIETIHATEPGMTIGSRAALSILSILPIDWLL